MLDALKSFFSRSVEIPDEEAAEAASREARLGACVLLLELAHADEEFTDSERDHLEGTIRRQFGLDEEEAAELLEVAAREREGAVDLFQFTRLIDRNFTTGQKMVLAEAMWGLVYADGELERREDYLIRKISNLLRLQPGYLAQARNRARGRRGKTRTAGAEEGDREEEGGGPGGEARGDGGGEDRGDGKTDLEDGGR